MNILVTGGAGYIGSFMVRRLLDDHHSVVVVDNLSRGHQAVIDERAVFQQGDLLDEAFMTHLFESQKIDAVFNFAGFISVGESMERPGSYFIDNTVTVLKLLEQMRKHAVSYFIFSSTAAVYGNPTTIPIPEDHPKNPENPYGESKLMVERILEWYQRIHKISFASLRYFNACGGELDGSLGEQHNPESHIIPNAIYAAMGKKPFTLYGSDYKTDDGTGVRDYIHVLDLVDAHVLALTKLENNQGGFTYNVGTGRGYSNKEVIEMVKEVSGTDFPITLGPRRPGDADVLVADPTKINTELGFHPKHSDIKTIVETAWKWHNREKT